MKIVKKFEEFRENAYEEDGSQIFTNVTDAGKFWGTVGAGVLPICKSTKRILIAFRSLEVNEPHTFGIWGGKLDDMETNDPKKACLIEFKEESGYKGNINLIDSFVFRKKDSNGNVVFTYHNYVGVLDKEFSPILDWETESFKWVTFKELIELEDKHFGLIALMENDMDTIKSICLG